MSEHDLPLEERKEILRGNYCNFNDQYDKGIALLLSHQESSSQPLKLILFLRTNDRVSIHPYQLEVRDGKEIFTRAPFWHAVDPGRTGDSCYAFLQILTPDGFQEPGYSEKEFGFRTRQGVENAVIYGTNDPRWSLLGVYAKTSELPEVKGDSFTLQLYENAFKRRYLDTDGTVKTDPFISEPRERLPQLMNDESSCWAAVEQTMPEDIHGLIVIREWKNKDIKKRLLFYLEKIKDLHIPLDQLSVCLAVEDQNRGESKTVIEETVGFKTLLDRYSLNPDELTFFTS